MAGHITQDQLAIIRVDGMHSHTCEREIQAALEAHEGVNEVEVDFLSGQASILFDAGKITVAQLTQILTEHGYRATGMGRSGEAASDSN
jgi:copper chaperone CopZ